MDLKDILEVMDDPTRPRWVEWSPGPLEPKQGSAGETPAPTGFAILLRLPNVPGINALAQAAIMESLRAAADNGGEGAEMDPGAVGLKLTSYMVQDWRGFTGRALRYFTAGLAELKINAAEDIEISFNRDLLEVLLQYSARFFNFVERAARTREAEAQAAVEEDDANLSLAPGSTPTPSDAPGA